MSMGQLVELVAVRLGEEQQLYNFHQLYCYDSSLWSGDDPLGDGLFDVNPEIVASYVNGSGKYAWWIRYEGITAGFILCEEVDIEHGSVLELADMFVLRRHRRKGIGSAAATQLLTDGRPWLVTVFRDDRQAVHFWSCLLPTLQLPLKQWREEAFPQFEFHLVNGPAGGTTVPDSRANPA